MIWRLIVGEVGEVFGLLESGMFVVLGVNVVGVGGDDIGV